MNTKQRRRSGEGSWGAAVALSHDLVRRGSFGHGEVAPPKVLHEMFLTLGQREEVAAACVVPPSTRVQG